MGTFASRGLSVGGSAMWLGIQDTKSKLSAIAAHILECDPEDIIYEDEKLINGKDPEQVMSFQEVCSEAHRPDRLPPGMEPGLEFKSSFSMPENPFGFGAHVAVIQVDPDTGDITFLNYSAVHDTGRVINPKLMEGQLHGGLGPRLGPRTHGRHGLRRERSAPQRQLPRLLHAHRRGHAPPAHGQCGNPSPR